MPEEDTKETKEKELHQRIDHLEKRLAGLRSIRVPESVQNFDKHIETVSTLENKVKSIEEKGGQFDKLKSTFSTHQRSLGTVQKSVTGVKQSVGSFQKSIGTVEKSVSDIRGSVERVEKSLDETEKKMKEFTSSLLGVQEKQEENTERVNHILLDNQKLVVDVKKRLETGADASSLKKHVDSVIKDYQNLSGRYQSLARQLSELQKTKDVGSVKNELDNLANKFQSFAKTQDQLAKEQRELSQTLADVDARERDLEDLRNRLGELDEEVGSLSVSHKGLAKQHKSLWEKHDPKLDTKRALDTHWNELAVLQKTQKNLVKEIEKLKSRPLPEQDTVSGVIEDLRAEVRTLADEITLLHSKHGETGELVGKQKSEFRKMLEGVKKSTDMKHEHVKQESYKSLDILLKEVRSLADTQKSLETGLAQAEERIRNIQHVGETVQQLAEHVKNHKTGGVLPTDVAALRNELHTLTEEQQTTKAEMIVLRRMIEGSKKHLQELNKYKRPDHDTRLATVEKQMTTIESGFTQHAENTAKSLEKRVEQRLTSLEQQLLDLQRGVENVAKQTDVHKRMAELETIGKQMTGGAAKAETLLQLRTEVKHLMDHFEKLEQQVHEMAVAPATSGKEDAKKALYGFHTELKKQIALLEKRIEENRNALHELTQEHEERTTNLRDFVRKHVGDATKDLTQHKKKQIDDRLEQVEKIAASLMQDAPKAQTVLEVRAIVENLEDRLQKMEKQKQETEQWKKRLASLNVQELENNIYDEFQRVNRKVADALADQKKVAEHLRDEWQATRRQVDRIQELEKSLSKTNLETFRRDVTAMRATSLQSLSTMERRLQAIEQQLNRISQNAPIILE
ncbi:MAG: hypothetical protein KKA90_04885 [Nanoarchaeota archaeon]|nr:hypothetical protein [Nanoarchaeota archaeon]